MKAAPVERLRRLPLWQPLAVRDFRLLWIGQSISLFGDQFYLVALYWLTANLSDSSVTLGSVLMVAGAAQAIFQLVGGAVGDHMSPRTLMLASDCFRAAITIIITITLYLGVTKLWHVYALAGLFGAVGAFFHPAYMSAIPMLIVSDHLPAGNALLRGTNHLMRSVGHSVAGVVIAYISLYAAFGIDAATFVVSAITLWMMRLKRRPGGADDDKRPGGEGGLGLREIFKSIGEGMRYAWGNRLIRSLLVFVAAIEFSFVGASSVGLTVMAKTMFGEESGASALGWMLGALGAGMFAGILLAGSVGAKRRRDRLVTGATLVAGICLSLLSLATNVALAALIMALVGLSGGLANITVMSWMQSGSDPRVLARVVSLMSFCVYAIEPLSYYLTGVVADYSLTLVFLGSGAIIILTSLVSFATGSLREPEPADSGAAI